MWDLVRLLGGFIMQVHRGSLGALACRWRPAPRGGCGKVGVGKVVDLSKVDGLSNGGLWWARVRRVRGRRTHVALSVPRGLVVTHPPT